MKIPKLLLLPLLCCTLTTQGQDTFSIIAVDPETGQVGSAGASCIAGSIIISGMLPGRGGMHSQASVCIPNFNLEQGLDWLDQGFSPQQTLDSVTGNDACGFGDASNRQYGIVDFNPDGGTRSAGYTGSNALNWKGHLTGPNYAIQGNILIGGEILDSMEARFLNATGTFPERMMAALQGANVPGADSRCLGDSISSLSAFIRVALPTDDKLGPYCLDINVNDSPTRFEPIDSVQTLFDIWNADCGLASAAFTHAVDSVNIAIQEKVAFTNTSSANIKTWAWQFGDHNRSWQSDPVHQYDSTGTFTVTLDVTDRSCIDQATSTVVAYYDCGPVNATFTQDVDTIDLASSSGLVQFSSDSATTHATGWEWDFGDNSGSLSTLPNPIHTYTEAGVFTVTLVVRNGDCMATQTSVVVAQWPASIYEYLDVDVVNIHVLPNPFSNHTTLDLRGIKQSWGPLNMELFNVAGKKIRTADLGHNRLYSFDRQALQNGFYYFRVTDVNGLNLGKGNFVIQ